MSERFGINCPWVHFWKFWIAISKLSNIARVIYPQNRLNKTCGYWLITPNWKALCIETKIHSRQLQNNSNNGAMLITINCVIIIMIIIKRKKRSPYHSLHYFNYDIGIGWHLLIFFFLIVTVLLISNSMSLILYVIIFKIQYLICH